MTIAEGIKKSILETAGKCNFRRKKNKKQSDTPWFDKECLDTKHIIRNLGNRLKSNPGNKEIRTKLFQQKRNLQKLVRSKKCQHKYEIINEMNSTKDQKRFWKLAKKLEQNATQNKHYVSPGNLYRHFKNIRKSNRVIKMPPDSHEKGKLDYPFTEEELKEAKKILRMGKATGIDNLSNEMISCFVEIYPQLTLKLFNKILSSNTIVPDWTLGIITTIFKTGSKTDPSNYRGITLLSCFGKLFMSLLNNRLQDFVTRNKIISPNQLGFLPGNRTSDAHLIIHNLIQNQCHKNGNKIFSCFIDFSKAFDTIPRDKLLEKLLKNDIKGNFFNTIKIYTVTIRHA